jgi:hypothetical protein
MQVDWLICNPACWIILTIIDDKLLIYYSCYMFYYLNIIYLLFKLSVYYYCKRKNTIRETLHDNNYDIIISAP